MPAVAEPQGCSHATTILSSQAQSIDDCLFIWLQLYSSRQSSLQFEVLKTLFNCAPGTLIATAVAEHGIFLTMEHATVNAAKWHRTRRKLLAL